MAALGVAAQQGAKPQEAQVPAGDPARAQEILKLARAAIGDESKLAGLKSLTAAGSSRRVFGEREMQSEVEIEMVMPDKLRRTTASNPFPGAEFQQIEVITGDQMWTDMVSSMPTQGGTGGGPGGGPGGRAMGMMTGGMPGMTEEQRNLFLKADLTRLLLGILIAPPPSVQVEYAWIGEAKAPDGVADVIQVKGPGDAKSMLYIDRNTHRVLMVSYRGRPLRMMMRPGGGGGQRGPGGQGAPGGAPGGAGPGAAQPVTPEEREKRLKELQEQMAKEPDVDYFLRFGDHKQVSGLTLPHLVTRATGDQTSEQWAIKYKVNSNIKPERFEKKEKK